MLITKELLKNKIFAGNSLFAYFIEFLCIVALFFIFWLKVNKILAIIVTSIFTIFACVGSVFLYKAEKKFDFSNLYVVEDVFINISLKKIVDTRHLRYDRFYTVKFSKNGFYRFYSYGKLKPDDTNTNYITATYSKPGDKYFLAILENKGKRRILGCYNQKYFKLRDSDFEFIDGKYICKQ